MNLSEFELVFLLYLYYVYSVSVGAVQRWKYFPSRAIAVTYLNLARTSFSSWQGASLAVSGSMSRLVLHMAPGSPPSRSVMMVAELLGLPLQCKMVNLLQLEHRTPQFKKLNPLATVPVLEDGDFVVCDSHAIIKYVMKVYGGDKQESLYPSEPRARALIDQRMFFNASFFFNKFSSVPLLTFIEEGKRPSQKHIEGIDSAYAALEQYLQTTRYVAADRLTVADLSVGATATAAQLINKLDANKFPRGAEWLSMIEAEPVFKKVNAPGVEVLAKLFKKFVTKNNR